MRSRSRRAPGLKSVPPSVWATGMSAPCITWSGMPSSSAAAFSSVRCSVVQQVPSPRARRRQHEAPHGGQQRAPDGGLPRHGQVVGAPLDARDHVDRHLGEVVGQVLGRADDLLRGRHVVGVVLRQVADDRVGVAVHRGEGRRVPLGQLGALGLVGHDDEVPALVVATRGRLRGDLDALAQELGRNRAAEVEALAHRPGGREELVRVKRQQGRHGRRRYPAQRQASGASCERTSSFSE